jgi:hypothetical protein
MAENLIYLRLEEDVPNTPGVMPPFKVRDDCVQISISLTDEWRVVKYAESKDKTRITLKKET